MGWDDPNDFYGNQSADGMLQQQAAAVAQFGDQQAMLTHMRAAYGPSSPATMFAGMMGGPGGMGGPFAQMGSSILPVQYTPPAMVMPAYGGMYQQQGGFMRSAGRLMGAYDTPFGMTDYSYRMNAAEDFGERLGGGMVSAGVAGAGMLFSNTVGRGAGGFLGSAVGAAFGGPIGAAVGGFVGQEFGAYAMGMSGAGMVLDAVGQRRDAEGYLDGASWRFFTSNADGVDKRRGAGMSRDTRQGVSEFLHQTDVADPLLNYDQLSDIMKKGGQLGLFNGTHDLQDFKKKFKETVENVKEVARTLHQTLDEGLQTIKELRGIGVDGSDASRMVLNASSLGKVAGRTGQEMLSLGLQGAEMFRGTGINMSIGAEANMMNVASVRAARDAGVLSQEAIAQAGGEESLATQMTAGGLGFAQSAFGRGYNAAFYDPKTGGLNAGALNASFGSGDLNSMFNQAAGNIADPRNMIKYQANQSKILSDMGKQNPMMLQLNQMNAMTMATEQMMKFTGNTNKEDADTYFRFLGKEQRMSDEQIDLMLGWKNDPEKLIGAQRSAAAAQRTDRVATEAIQNNMFYRLQDKLEDRYVKPAVAFFARPLNNAENTVAEAFTTSWERNVYGLERADASGYDYRMFGGQRGEGRSASIDNAPIFARSSGEGLLDAAESGVLGADAKKNFRVKLASEVGKGDVIVRKNLSANIGAGFIQEGGYQASEAASKVLSGAGIDQSLVIVADQQYVGQAGTRAIAQTVSLTQAMQMERDGKLKGQQAFYTQNKVDIVTNAQRLGQMTSANDVGQFFSALRGKATGIDDVSQSDIAAARVQFKDFQGIQETLDRIDAGNRKVGAAADSMNVNKMQSYVSDLNDVKSGLGGQLKAELGGADLARGTMENLIKGKDTYARAVELDKAGKTGEAAKLRKEAAGYEAAAIQSQAASQNGTGNRFHAEIAATTFGNIIEGGGGQTTAALLEKGRGALVGLAQTQATRGRDDVMRAVMNDIGGGNLSAAEFSSAKEAAELASTEEGLLGMDDKMIFDGSMGRSKSQLKLLASSGAAGAQLVNIRKAMLKIKGMDGTESQDTVRKAATESGLSGASADLVAKEWLTAKGTADQRKEAAMHAAYSTSLSAVSGDQAASVATSGGSAGMGAGSGNDTFSAQVGALSQITTILGAIANRFDRMGGK